MVLCLAPECSYLRGTPHFIALATPEMEAEGTCVLYV